MATPTLPREDDDPEARRRGLEEDRETYRFDFSTAGFAFAAEVPRRDRFDARYIAEVIKNKLELASNLAASRLSSWVEDEWDGARARIRKRFDDLGTEDEALEAALADADGEHQGRVDAQHPLTLDDYCDMHPVLVDPRSMSLWREDWYFAWQRIAGCNPALIERVTELPDHFPVTQAHLRGRLAADSLDAARAEGRLYMVDHAILDGVPAGETDGRPKYLDAPLSLFIRGEDGLLAPVAIQRGQVLAGRGRHPRYVGRPPHGHALPRLWCPDDRRGRGRDQAGHTRCARAPRAGQARAQGLRRALRQSRRRSWSRFLESDQRRALDRQWSRSAGGARCWRAAAQTGARRVDARRARPTLVASRGRGGRGLSEPQQHDEAAALARAFARHLEHLQTYQGLAYVGAGPMPREGVEEPALEESVERAEAAEPARESKPTPEPKPQAEPAPKAQPAPAQKDERARAQDWTAARKLEFLRNHIGDCRRCPLCETRNSLVFGVGDPDADLLFVGEAPGAQEDRRGEPFVGPAGQRLTHWIEWLGYRRDQVYIANVIKCRPPGNRDPRPLEIDRCSPFLHAQVRAINPKVIRRPRSLRRLPAARARAQDV